MSGEKDSVQDAVEGESLARTDAVPAPTKTPLYAAYHAARYARQLMIKAIEKQTKRKLLCYVASGEINRDDVMHFVDMLHNVPQGHGIDLLLHTPGGDIDAAEKLIHLLHSKVKKTGMFKIVIPDFAKSAGTLMALGADEIVMSDTSELGTIDPQYLVKDTHGNDVSHSVLDYIDSYDDSARMVRDKPDDAAARMMFAKFDPALLNKYKAVKKRARILGENLLKRKGLNYTAIVSALMDTSRYPSHGQMIDWEDAKEMGLSVEYLGQEDALWRQYWDLFCQYRLQLANCQKIYESAYASHLV